MENQVKISRFIQKEDFNNLALCISLTVGLTEIFKIIFPFLEPKLFVIAFSFLVSYSKMHLNNEDATKDDEIIAFFNVIPIALGAIGSYEMILKALFKIVNIT